MRLVRHACLSCSGSAVHSGGSCGGVEVRKLPALPNHMLRVVDQRTLVVIGLTPARPIHDSAAARGARNEVGGCRTASNHQRAPGLLSVLCVEGCPGKQHGSGRAWPGAEQPSVLGHGSSHAPKNGKALSTGA